MTDRQEVRFGIAQAIKTLDTLDVFILSQILQTSDDQPTFAELSEALGITEEEFDVVSKRASRRLVEALTASTDERRIQ